MQRRFLALVATIAMMVGMLAGPALAGEVTGTGESTPIREGAAASICAFSGLDDDDPEDDAFFGRTQSYGQLVQQGLKAFAPSPGVACNPTAGAPH